MIYYVMSIKHFFDIFSDSKYVYTNRRGNVITNVTLSSNLISCMFPIDLFFCEYISGVQENRINLTSSSIQPLNSISSCQFSKLRYYIWET